MQLSRPTRRRLAALGGALALAAGPASAQATRDEARDAAAPLGAEAGAGRSLSAETDAGPSLSAETDAGPSLSAETDAGPSLSEIDIDALLAPEAPPEESDPPAETLFQALLSARASARWIALRSRVEDALAGAWSSLRARLPESARSHADAALEASWPAWVGIAGLHVVGGALLLVLALPLLRGRGDVVVSLAYPAELRGTFTVRIARSRGRRRPGGRKPGRVTNAVEAAREKRKAPTATRTRHPLVSRETTFRDFRAGRWCVSAEGFLQPAQGETVLASFCEEREVTVQRGRTVRTEFDFQPRSCTAEVRVVWDRRPVREALVAVAGQPDSLRFARGAPARLSLPRGEHRLVVGSADRVAEHPVEVVSFEPLELEVDLTEHARLLFTGCPPAVTPYLHGDVPAAARALERDGQPHVAHLLLARLALERNQKELAARHFERADRPGEAAELRLALSQFERSAALFEKAGEGLRAAETYRSAGDLVRAGEIYERERALDSAVECFKQAGEIARWIEALEAQGQPFAAARVSMDREDWGRAIRSLQLVIHADPHYAEAARQLVRAYRREGHLDLAAAKVDELARVRGVEALELEACDDLAGALEEGGELERAIGVLELMRQRDATWPNVASRIEALRKGLREGEARTAGFGGGSEAELRYEIQEEIGRGGMGVVFKARDRRLDRVVALKRLPDNLRSHPKAIELFLREARSAAAMNHPNIVTVYDAGEEAGTYYIAMELLQGWPMATLLKSRRRLGGGDVCRLGVQIAKGLQYAHERRIVHRDIKTANLFFTNARKVKIMDFGLAKMIEEVRRAATVIGGTPFYMAPEQSRGDPVDHRADLYALGVTFYELLTGRVPFLEGDVAYHHRHTPVPDPRDSAPEVPDEVAELVLELMAKSPNRRPASAAAVAERLLHIARGLSQGPIASAASGDGS